MLERVEDRSELETLPKELGEMETTTLEVAIERKCLEPGPDKPRILAW